MAGLSTAFIAAVLLLAVAVQGGARIIMPASSTSIERPAHHATPEALSALTPRQPGHLPLKSPFLLNLSQARALLRLRSARTG
jgi:hypothetical protein